LLGFPSLKTTTSFTFASGSGSDGGFGFSVLGFLAAGFGFVFFAVVPAISDGAAQAQRFD
jgi:hypothetical protein